jgi:hypothetical protein
MMALLAATITPRSMLYPLPDTAVADLILAAKGGVRPGAPRTDAIIDAFVELRPLIGGAAFATPARS